MTNIFSGLSARLINLTSGKR